MSYLLTPYSTVLREKLTGSAASQEIPCIFGTWRFITVLTSSRQLHPVPTSSSQFLKIHLSIILPSSSGSPQWSLSLQFPHQNPVHTSPLRHTRHMPRPSITLTCVMCVRKRWLYGEHWRLRVFYGETENCHLVDIVIDKCNNERIIKES